MLLKIKYSLSVQIVSEKFLNFQLLLAPVIMLHLFTFAVPLRCHTLSLSKHTDVVMKT